MISCIDMERGGPCIPLDSMFGSRKAGIRFPADRIRWEVLWFGVYKGCDPVTPSLFPVL